MQILPIFAMTAAAAILGFVGYWISEETRFAVYGQLAEVMTLAFYAAAVGATIAATFQVKQIMDDGSARRGKPRYRRPRNLANRVSMLREQRRTDWPGYTSTGRPKAGTPS